MIIAYALQHSHDRCLVSVSYSSIPALHVGKLRTSLIMATGSVVVQVLNEWKKIASSQLVSVLAI